MQMSVTLLAAALAGPVQAASAQQEHAHEYGKHFDHPGFEPIPRGPSR